MNDRDKQAHAHLARAQTAIDAAEKTSALEHRASLYARAQVEATMANAEAALSVALETRNIGEDVDRLERLIGRELPIIRGAIR